MTNLHISKTLKTNAIPLEVDLVRACARLELSQAGASWIHALLKVKPDWRKVHMLANHHRLLPLVYRRLYTDFREQVPAEAMEQLHTGYQANAARNFFLTQELLKILEVFESEGTDAIAIKGPALAIGVYGDVTYREFDDLDLLVRDGDVAKVSEVLLAQSYSPVVAAAGSEAEILLRKEGERRFASPCGRYHVDIHWQMAPRSFLDLDHEGLWERSGFMDIHGKAVRVFSPEDLLFLLCFHGMRHLWTRHVWIADLIELLHTPAELDWDEIFDRSRPIQMERFLNVGLLLGSWYDRLNLPEWVSNQIRADQAAWNLVKDLRASPHFHLPQETSLVNLAFMNARAREGIRSRFSYFIGQLLSPSLEDWSIIRMPAAAKLFYPILRPVRLLMAYGPGALAKQNALQGTCLPLEEGKCN